MKRYLLFITALLFSIATTFAQGGTTGPLTWTINNGTLTISGNGDMPDYNEENPPWRWKGFNHIVIENGVTRIGTSAFFGEPITSVNLGNTITSIGNRAFYACRALTSVTIPNSVISIENAAFWVCSSLQSVIIGNSVASIGGWAFYLCSLTSIVSYAEIAPDCDGWAFMEVPRNIPITIPCLSYHSYINDPVWKNFTNYLIDGSPTPGTTYYTAKCYTPYSDDNFIVPINNHGIYYTSIPNATGCDSILCLTLLEKPVPQLCMISVDDKNHNEIIWEKQEEVVSYNIYREEIQTGNYKLVANIPDDNPNIWVDMESNARVRSYRYKIAGVDTCGKESVLSLAHKTMHLVIYPGMGNSWNLIWTPYEGASYSTYNIYRSAGETIGELELIGTMPAGGNTSFTDFSAPEGYVYYMVEIIFDSPCVLSRNFFSIKSNIATNKALTPDVPEHNVTLYPNPTTGELQVTSDELQITSIEVFDVYGRKLLSFTPRMSQQQTLDISQFSAGIYFVKIGTEAGKVVRKVVKE